MHTKLSGGKSSNRISPQSQIIWFLSTIPFPAFCPKPFAN